MAPPILSACKIDISHQEMSRIVSELDDIWASFTDLGDDGAPSPIEWLPVDGVALALCEELGYEDMAEFEDALNGSFADFLDNLPHVAKRTRDDGRVVFQIKPEPPRGDWAPTRLVFNVTDRSDLWRVCLKSPHATVIIPELEFEFSADGKRHVDSLYNHIASAVFNLGVYVSSARGSMGEDTASKIMDTVQALNVLLDVESPWTWVVEDPSGLSELKPDDKVVSTPL